MARFFKDARTVYFKDSRAATESFEDKLFREPVLWKLLLLSALAYLVWSGKVSIVLNTGSPISAAGERVAHPIRASIFDQPAAAGAEIAALPKPAATRRPEVEIELPAGSLNNLTFAIDPGYAERHGIGAEEVEKRLAACTDYVGRFAPVAVAEMRKYGIPASITLAQGLLESNAGDSKLARKSNNHFGIKCFSKKCGKGHCVNFTDDSHKDFFIRYANIWGSYRAHSELLRGKASYRNLFDLGPGDYRGWARGLAAAGYATDKRYGDKLIALIQQLDLHRFDAQ
jgi:hypothetical protein